MSKQLLKPCPCGRPLDNLLITGEGSINKYSYVSGNCCSEWSIEFRSDYNHINSTECMELAIEAWNRAPRWEDE